jgi:hypothetical protein
MSESYRNFGPIFFCNWYGNYLGKSALYTHGIDDFLSAKLGRIFPFQHLSFSGGLIYLGFNLKPNNYGKEDWRWLLSRIEKRITLWCNRWISRGGRLALIKYVLEAIPVFWHTLAHTPKGILEKVKTCCFNYLWKRSSEYKGSHLASWKLIAIPKKLGGWGLFPLLLAGVPTVKISTFAGILMSKIV